MEVQKETSQGAGLGHLPRIVVFDAGKEECWSLMPSMLKRIGIFAREHCSDTVPEFLVQSVKQDFVQPQPGFLILGAVDNDYNLIGHLLACVSVPSWGQKRRCLILQYCVDDDARIPINFIRAALELVVDFAKTQYCSEIIAETKTEKAKRAFMTFYDFQVDLVQVKRAL